ncbi:MAG: hypothetical protein AABW45_01940 [Nanoarchaeota archaeon]
MESFTIGYKWYNFKIYLEENKIEILDDKYNVIKKVEVVFDSGIEKILKERNPEMIKFFENILREVKLK